MSGGPGIDLDRGCIKRTHPSGMQICMYEDNPGVYYDGNGVRVKDQLASFAGYDVSALAKLRERNVQMEKMRQQVDAQFEETEVKLARLASEGADGAEIKPVGDGKYAVYQGEERITPFPMSLNEAEDLLSGLSMADEEDGGNEESNETEAAPKKGRGRKPKATKDAKEAQNAEGENIELI